MRIIFLLVLVIAVSTSVGQDGSQPTVRPRTANPDQTSAPPSDTVKPATTTRTPSAGTASQTTGSAAVLAAFERLLNGIRDADLKAVTNVYWNSPQLVLFNYNGTVTKGWEQMRKNRESSYPKISDVKLDVRDVSVIMLGRDGALVSCLWTQTQNYEGASESASGRMSLVFRRSGNEWKAIHLHTSPDKEDPSRVLPSEQAPPPPSPTPALEP